MHFVYKANANHLSTIITNYSALSLNMALNFLVLATLVAAARAGVIAPQAVSYSSVSAPVASYAAPVSYGAPVASYAAPVSYGAPVAYRSPVSYAAPALKVAAPLAYSAPVSHEVYPDAPAQYEYGYSISDPHTGDSKSQHEVRNGDAVHGSYSLIDADGTKRTVEYTADDHNGFNAIVHKEPAAVAVKAVAPVVKTAYAAPAVSAYAPITKYAAAPAVSYSSLAAPGFSHASPGYYH